MDYSDSEGTVLLLDEGFTGEEAAKIESRSIGMDSDNKIANVRLWMEMRVNPHVVQPTEVSAKQFIVMKNLAEMSADDDAASIVQWMLSLHLQPDEVAKIIARFPPHLNTLAANMLSVDAWLRTELDFNDGMISTALGKYPRFFTFRLSSLALRVAWFRSKGFSQALIRRIFTTHYGLLATTVQHYDSQLLVLQALGLSEDQAVALVVKTPTVLSLELSCENQQAKLRFLTQVMGKSILELEMCSGFLTYSMERIATRWAFFNLHCSDQPQLKLGQLLQMADAKFTDGPALCSSLSLRHECNSGGLARLEVFHKFVSQWKEGEGRIWIKEKKEKQRPRKVKREAPRKESD